MTTIQLNTSDQHLIASQKVKIAAGDINSVILRVEFDAAWDEFTTRKAVFANDAVNGSEAIDALLTDDACTVPHEVLSSEGTLEISMTGYTTDGTTKKTSTIVKLKVLKSLKDASTTVAPTMDLYMQYLAALSDKLNPVTENINAQLQSNLAAVNEAIAEQREWMGGTVLWENPDPSAEIGGEGLVINIDRTPYKRLEILILSGTLDEGQNVETTMESWIQCSPIYYNGYYPVGSLTGTKARTITVKDTSITIGDCTHTADSTIPYKIIGYKY